MRKSAPPSGRRTVTSSSPISTFAWVPLLASRVMTGWLYNATGASVLIAGLFHATFNATVNPTGLAVAVLDLPQDEVVVVVGALVVVAAAVVTVATHGRLGRRGGGDRPASVESGPIQPGGQHAPVRHPQRYT